MFFFDFTYVFSSCFDFCLGLALFVSNKAIFSLSNWLKFDFHNITIESDPPVAK